VALSLRSADALASLEAFNALETSLQALQLDITRTMSRCREVRRAYERVIEAAAGGCPSKSPLDPVLGRLSPRERLVARLAAGGWSNAQVAAELNVSLHTVKTQMQSVLRKLQLDSRWQIVRAVGLTELESQSN
jgi:LuxR family maltose regulon positive regulatory protein